jgi:subtilisin-like proprotein convertase family protein/subtilisin family serine protease
MDYTYRNGEKIELGKKPDQFVVRALPDALAARGMAGAERVSSRSSRVVAAPGALEAEMARSRAIAPTHHAYTVAESGADFLITDRIFVSFKPAAGPDDIAGLAGRYALRHLTSYSPTDHLFQLTDATGMNPVKLVVKLVEDEPLVQSAENDLNYVAAKAAFALPTDAHYARQWHLHAVADPAVDDRAHARCEQAWQLLQGFGSRDVVVGVTDDGCRLDHGDFDSPGKFAGWGYFEGTRLVRNHDIDALPARMYQNGANHGTSCAGVIAGEVDAALTVGAAPGCRLLPIKWESQGASLLLNDSKLMTALEFMADKVDIVSNSWGIVPTNLFATPVVNRIRALAQTGGRRGRGILFLWAMGNENCPIQHDAAQDVPYTGGWGRLPNGTVGWVGVETTRRFRNNLAGVPGVLHVAALASTAQRSHYSNYGTGVALCAPTSNSHAYWRLTLPGLGVTTATGAATRVTHEFGGTSSATPLVAGVAALAVSANANLSALQLASLLRRTASRNLSLAGWPRTTPASFDPDPSWDVSPVAPFDRGDFQDIGHPDGSWSPWFGHGRVDAMAAVSAALGSGVTPPQPGARHELRPQLAIPDNHAAGVRSAMQVAQAGLLASLKVGVDIRHSYRGDLVVTLSAPSGRSVRLHDRAGGSAADLQTTFDTTTTPALAALRGETVAGTWTLQVQDLAPADAGRLERWGLDFAVLDDPAVELEDAPGVTIPDADPTGIVRHLDVPGAGGVRDLEVALDITHSYIGDLRVTLTAPGGTTVLLHDRLGADADNIVRNFTAATSPALQPLLGVAAQGRWTLRVADLAAIDVGKLNRWKLKLTRVPQVAAAGRAAPPRAARASRPRRGG